jgi:hypothetical protein
MKLQGQSRKKSNKAPKSKLVFGLFSPWSLAGMLLGGLGGFVFYLAIGSRTEGCAFVSNPYLSILWGALLALILAEVIRIILITDEN